MIKYNTLINILDKIKNEAPAAYTRYYPEIKDLEKINQARSRSYIHLFLKVKFGILDFEEREHFITDGSNDGGIDGYYISKEEKKIYIIQSKFRTNPKNFENKEIELNEILQMDVAEITEGKTENESGIKYNGKIQQLIREISQIEDIGKYNYKTIILANLSNIPNSKLRLLTGGFPCEVFNFEKSYEELVFPVVSGTYYNISELYININLDNKGGSSKVSYKVETEFKDCNITVLFVPTIEIAKILHKYKNSILKFNPRSYLDLASSYVNRSIRETIVNKKTNEFALFNNGITMLSDETNYNENIGIKDKAQLTVTNGQIINGGQTAFTLSLIYDSILKENRNPIDVLGGKEVLLKVITFDKTDDETKAEKKLQLIEAISKATNQQTEVTEADRRSNDKIQIEIQEKIFNDFGYYYERKRGEFGDGLRNKYIDRSLIINRDHFIRICMAVDGKPSQARRNSENVNFSESNFKSVLKDSEKYKDYFYGFICFEFLNRLQNTFEKINNNSFGEINYGNALRYGKYSVVSVFSRKRKEIEPNESYITQIEQTTLEILSEWLNFEKYAESQFNNSSYFRKKIDDLTNDIRLELNYTGYYKGRTINDDLKGFFK